VELKRHGAEDAKLLNLILILGGPTLPGLTRRTVGCIAGGRRTDPLREPAKSAVNAPITAGTPVAQVPAERILMQHLLNRSCLMIALFSACASTSDASTADLARAELTYPEACTDTDAPPESTSECLFGEVFSDIRSNPALELTSEIWITTIDELTELDGEQLLIAVQQSSHTDVATPAEALERVDQQEVRRIDFYELASGREFVVYEYGVGDNSYGAFFELEGVEVAAAIHDGDLLDCSVSPLDSSE
jgi:hypothetical protein